MKPSLAEKWSTPHPQFFSELENMRQSVIDSYRAHNALILEHFNLEDSIRTGAYATKQINELVQNAADPMEGLEGRIKVLLTPKYLYCANEGMPFDLKNIRSLQMAYSSTKSGNDIGRFGLGFKSILAISDAPEIFSRSGSFSFNPSQFEADLAEHGLPTEKVPKLRLAYPLDALHVAESDHHLASMMDWSSTVIRIPLASDNFDFLHASLHNFPGEFLLFSDKVGTLELVDTVPGFEFQTTFERHQNQENKYAVDLTKNNEVSQWRVFEMIHRPSEKALNEVANNTARKELTVSWAIQVGGARDSSNRRGQYWQHFPTAQHSLVSGIFNAPFHLNDDRANLRESLFNKEIITRTIPQLVALSLPHVFTPEEPAKILDIYPTTMGGWMGWWDKILRQPMLEVLAISRSIPTASGELKTPAEVNLPPFSFDSVDNGGAEIINEFYNQLLLHPHLEKQWVHKMGLAKSSRYTVLKEIFVLAHKETASIRQMLEAFIHSTHLDGIRSALNVAAKIFDVGGAQEISEMQEAKILLDGFTNRRPVKPYEMTLINSFDDIDENKGRFVHPMIYRDQKCASSLRKLRFRIEGGLNNLTRALQVLSRVPNDPSKVRDAWRSTINLDDSQSDIVAEIQRFFPHGTMPVIYRNGEVGPVGRSWLVGNLVSDKNERDRAITVDLKSLGNVAQLIQALGGRRSLDEAVTSGKNNPTFEWWADNGLKHYCRQLKEVDAFSARPQMFRLQPQLLTPGIETLISASLETRAKVTIKAAESNLNSNQPQSSQELIGCTSQLDSPNLYWIKNYGVVETTYGLIEFADLCISSKQLPAELQPQFVNEDLYKSLRPYLDQKVTFEKLVKPAHDHLSIAKIHELYAAIAKSEENLVPGKRFYFKAITTSGVKPMLAAEIFVTHTDSATQHILKHHDHQGVIQVSNAYDAKSLCESWGLRQADIQFNSEVDTDGELDRKRLKEIIPFLGKGIEKTRNLMNIEVIECVQVREIISNDFDAVAETKNVKAYYEKETKSLYHAHGITPLVLLQTVLDVLDSQLVAKDIIKKSNELNRDEKKRALIARVNEAEDINEKLLALLGAEKLEQIMPEDVLEMIENVTGKPVSPNQYGSILESIHGVDLLKALRQYMPEDNTPSRFAGGAKAVDWVTELGFDEAFAGIKNVKLPPQEFFSGPVRLPALHDYQQSVSNEIINLLSSGNYQKSFISLPTGSGKTRVATESVVKYCSQESVPPQLVVWVAATNELCEQAVSSWSSVWQSFGKINGSLAISRLWDSRRPEKANNVDLHVVVATYQTLNRIKDNEIFDWLKDANILIIDEAHGALARSFTSILDWFGRGVRSKKLKGHLLGLSATPYRGYSEEETDHLAVRFNRNLFEPEEFANGTAHKYLQKIGVLSHDEYDELDGITLKKRKLTERERSGVYTDGTPAKEATSNMAELSLDVDQIVNSSERNAQIVNHLRKRYAENPDSSTILFAASVSHAVALAATLTILGIPAATVSSSSSPAARRRAIEGFRNGTYKVLTNYGVLSEGFDAPKCDAVYIARPVFSPNRYLQMIGRGLRGPKNGGSNKTLIVNVRDNTENFDQKLAFDDLKKPWMLQ